MAILVAEGFDDSSNNTANLNKNFPSGALVTSAGSATISATSPRYGTGRYMVGANGASYLVTLPSTASEIYAAMAVARVSSDSGDVVIFQTRDGASVQADIRMTQLGECRATRNGTSLALSGVVFPLNTWVWLSVYIKINDSTGRVVVKVDGTTVIDFTGDTQNTANAYMTICGLVMGTGVDMNIDDFFIMDTTGSSFNGHISDTRIVPFVPTADGSLSQWTASAGSDWQCVDEIPANDDTDYISDSTPNNVSLFTTAAMSGLGQILGVFSTYRAKKDDAGTRQVRAVTKSGSTTDNSATKDMTSSYVNYVSTIYETDPNTSSAWTPAGADAVEFGVETVA